MVDDVEFAITFESKYEPLNRIQEDLFQLDKFAEDLTETQIDLHFEAIRNNINKLEELLMKNG